MKKNDVRLSKILKIDKVEMQMGKKCPDRNQKGK